MSPCCEGGLGTGMARRGCGEKADIRVLHHCPEQSTEWNGAVNMPDLQLVLEAAGRGGKQSHYLAVDQGTEPR